MGVRCLNKFINKYCKKAICKIQLNALYGKKLAIDTNIYMYKFTENNELIEQFYLMISLFKQHNIKPIFIFDGKIDSDKMNTILRRKHNKIVAENKYNELLLDTNPNHKDMVLLKKQFTKVPRIMFNEVKKLIDIMGETYIDAPYEADELCSWLVKNNYAHGCLSEDTDLFVYGCPRVYKSIDLNTESLFRYDYYCILKQMNIDDVNFKQLCLISDNDYNYNNKGFHYYYFIYKKYKSTSFVETFYDWLIINNYNFNYRLLSNLYKKFLLPKAFDYHIDNKKKFNKNDLIKFLKNYNFIFI